MPRGVPAHGRRPSRPVTAEPEPTDAYDTEDVEDRDDQPAEDETTTPEPAPVLSLEGVPRDQLTPEQAEIKRLRDLLARESGRKDVAVPVAELHNPGDESNILIHILEDGFTGLGKVWYRGEELEFERGGQAYKDTYNKIGESWLDLRHDEFAQAERWGKIMFRKGPWPGKTYADGTFESLRALEGDSNVKPPSAEELALAEKARKRRAAPHLPAGI